MSIFKWFQEKRMWSAYFVFMLLSYIGYVTTDIIRYTSIQPSDNGYISKEDLDMKNELASWSNTFELVFLALFVAAFLLACFKRRSLFIKNFFVVNIALFIGIMLLGVVLLYTTTSPIGNLLQPLLLPKYLLALTFIYLVFSILNDKFLREK